MAFLLARRTEAGCLSRDEPWPGRRNAQRECFHLRVGDCFAQGYSFSACSLTFCHHLSGKPVFCGRKQTITGAACAPTGRWFHFRFAAHGQKTHSRILIRLSLDVSASDRSHHVVRRWLPSVKDVPNLERPGTAHIGQAFKYAARAADTCMDQLHP